VAEYESDDALHSCISRITPAIERVRVRAFLQVRNDVHVISSNNAGNFVIAAATAGEQSASPVCRTRNSRT